MLQFNENEFFPDEIKNINFRRAENNYPDSSIFLDKNELPFDIPADIKEKICQKLQQMPWNNYPKAYNSEIERLISNHINAHPSQIIISSGAGSIITMLFNFFKDKQFVIPYPSFSLFEYHCRTHSLNYTKWPLNKNFEFDLSLFPKIQKPSIIIIDSPNNPSGAVLEENILIELAERQPDSLFIIDEVYTEFSPSNYQKLLEKYNNIILIRSFSKAFGLAGLRLGYLITNKEIALHLRKILLPFIIGQHGAIALKELLQNKKWLNDVKMIISKITESKNQLYTALIQHSQRLNFEIKMSQTNFLLLLFRSKESIDKCYMELVKHNIYALKLPEKINDKYLMRITVGSNEANNKFLSVIKSINFT